MEDPSVDPLANWKEILKDELSEGMARRAAEQIIAIADEKKIWTGAFGKLHLEVLRRHLTCMFEQPESSDSNTRINQEDLFNSKIDDLDALLDWYTYSNLQMIQVSLQAKKEKWGLENQKVYSLGDLGRFDGLIEVDNLPANSDSHLFFSVDAIRWLNEKSLDAKYREDVHHLLHTRRAARVDRPPFVISGAQDLVNFETEYVIRRFPAHLQEFPLTHYEIVEDEDSYRAYLVNLVSKIVNLKQLVGPKGVARFKVADRVDNKFLKHLLNSESMTRIDLILTGSERHGSRRVPHYSGFPIPDDIKTLIRERQRSRPLSLDVLEAIPLVLPVDYSNQVVAGQVMDLTPSLLRKVEEFGLGIAHRPHLAGRVIETFREAKKALEVVSDEEQVRFSCEKGVEDGSLEFKESFKRNKGTGKNDKVLSDRVFQVIVGMINTNGGLLLIGIHDETKEPTDLFEKEVLGAGKPKDSIGKCKDKFLNAFGNQFGACIGAEWHRSYSAAFVDYKGKPVFKVEVEKRPEGKFAYFEKKDPYIRTPTGSTEKPTHREWVDLTET